MWSKYFRAVISSLWFRATAATLSFQRNAGRPYCALEAFMR
jgi:hypothetical protein